MRICLLCEAARRSFTIQCQRRRTMNHCVKAERGREKMGREGRGGRGRELFKGTPSFHLLGNCRSLRIMVSSYFLFLFRVLFFRVLINCGVRFFISVVLLFCFVLFCFVLFCFVLFCFVLYCFGRPSWPCM